VLRPLRSALAVLRNASEAEDAARRREAIEAGRAEATEYHPARERLSSTAKGGAMDWKRVEERARLYAAAHSGLVPRVGLLDAQLGMAVAEVFGRYVHEMEIFPELTRRKARQLAAVEARVAGLEEQAQRAEAEAAQQQQQLATSEGARSLTGARQHKRELELLEAQRALSLLEAAREQDMAQLTKAVRTGREAVAALKAFQAAKDDNFTKLVVLRAELEAALQAQHESEGRSHLAAAALSAVELEVPEVRREAEEAAVVARREIGDLKRTAMVRELSIAREKAATQQRSELLERREEEVQRLHEELAVLRSKHKDSERELRAMRRRSEDMRENLKNTVVASGARAIELEGASHQLTEELLALRSQQRDTEGSLHEASVELRRIKGGAAATWLVATKCLQAEVEQLEQEVKATAGAAAELRHARGDAEVAAEAAEAAEVAEARAEAAEVELGEARARKGDSGAAAHVAGANPALQAENERVCGRRPRRCSRRRLSCRPSCSGLCRGPSRATRSRSRASPRTPLCWWAVCTSSRWS